MKATLQLAWDRFNVIAGIMGDVQGRAIVTAFYFTILVPFGIGARVFSNSLRLRPENPHWLERAPVQNGLEDARRQG